MNSGLLNSVIASGAKQSSVAWLDSGLPRFARNDDLSVNSVSPNAEEM